MGGRSLPATMAVLKSLIVTAKERSMDIQVFPAMGYEIEPLPALGALFIRLPFVTHPSQSPHEPDPGRRYLFSPAQARELAHAILSTLDAMESGPPESSVGPTH